MKVNPNVVLVKKGHNDKENPHFVSDYIYICLESMRGCSFSVCPKFGRPTLKQLQDAADE